MSDSIDDARYEVRRVARRLAEDPAAWDSLREPTRRLFEQIAPEWESRVGPHHVALLDAALEAVPPPRVALDLGTGTGVGADAIVRHFPDAAVLGADLAEGMVRLAAAKPRPRAVRFLVADGYRLPLRRASLDLVVALNVFVFGSEVARVLGPEGRLAVLYSRGEETPIFLPTEDLHRHLRAAGFTHVREQRAALGIFHIAQR